MSELVETRPTYCTEQIPMTPTILQTAPASFRLRVAMLLGSGHTSSRCKWSGSQEPAGRKAYRPNTDQGSLIAVV
jgi:hypothetical protein